ncbi:DUF2147 domain-containing protein [Spirochaetota bacterium]
MILKRVLFVVVFTVCFFAFNNSFSADPSPIGVWKTISDEGEHKGKASSYIQIFEKNGVYYGKVIKLLLDPQDKKCDKCTGALKNKRIVGMTILKNMKKEGDTYKGGKIMDPGNGKTYRCKFWLMGNNKLKVRGYLLFFYRTSYWYRVK